MPGAGREEVMVLAEGDGTKKSVVEWTKYRHGLGVPLLGVPEEAAGTCTLLLLASSCM